MKGPCFYIPIAAETEKLKLFLEHPSQEPQRAAL